MGQAPPDSMGALAKANAIEEGLTTADKTTASDSSWQGSNVTFLEAVGRPGPLSLITLATCISFGLGTTVGVVSMTTVLSVQPSSLRPLFTHQPNCVSA